MPTGDEWVELNDSCDWTWTTLNDVVGYKVKASNGNSIFLPAAGNRFNNTHYNASLSGNYWSSKLYTYGPSNAIEMYFLSDDHHMNVYFRYFGYSVRPVLSKSTSIPTALRVGKVTNIFAENGRIVCDGEFTIYDLLGRDVTRMNGQLSGVYIVKSGDKAQKVIVR